jgi:pyruvate kinase
LQGVSHLRDGALEFEAVHADDLARILPTYRSSARNLLHYLSVRQNDIRQLQLDLQSLGLSSLGVSEGHVLASINAVIGNLEVLAGDVPQVPPQPPADFMTGSLYLRDHTRRLFGPAPASRPTRIMVTMPSEAAGNPALVEALLRAGMDIMRINCAHDGPAEWRAMADNLRRAERVLGRSCRIQADLAGPKLRTGPLEPAGHMLRLRPAVDAMGRLTKPARAWLTLAATPELGPEEATCVPLATMTGAWRRARTLVAEDLRSRRRLFRVLATTDRSLLVEVERGVHLAPGTVLEAHDGEGVAGRLVVGDLPPVIEPIRLAVGDCLVLTREAIPGQPASNDPRSGTVRPAHIQCSLPAAFGQVKPGERVWLDDGKIGGIVRANDGATLEVMVTHAAPGGARLRAEKGINFPDSDLQLDALTDKDRADLREVVQFADLVALSFLRKPEDVRLLHQELRELSAGHLGTVLKIENATAFRNLPRILLASLESPPVGVMVARGDLAVEVGFERLSELQEEILWLCEAAHVPVIWATQVLEGLAKGGAPTRAEVSDAVMSSRAECVMLNKGPRIVHTVTFLANVLERMSEHHDKRMTLMRRLSVSEL